MKPTNTQEFLQKKENQKSNETQYTYTGNNSTGYFLILLQQGLWQPEWANH
jgi:hypothetical protein